MSAERATPGERGRPGEGAGPTRPPRPAKRIRRIILPILAAVAVLAPLAWFWASSLTPSAFSVTGMGPASYGGGSAAPHDGHGQPPGHDHAGMSAGRSVTSFVVDPARKADVVVHLVARRQSVTVGGRQVDGYTLNGRTPGPTITAVQGQLIEVHLHNASVPEGVTLHWHGVDVPNAEDGVAGVTQDAVAPGQDFTYRFFADHAGSFWYHSHQVSNEQVSGGLLGALVIKPHGPDRGRDVLALTHLYDGVRTINGRAGDQRVPASPGERVRVRVINTDNGPLSVWSTAGYRVLAVDGRELHGPTVIENRWLDVPAGGRADLEITAPAAGSAVRVQISGSTSVIIGSGDTPRVGQPPASVDLLHYGTTARLPFDPGSADRRFEYSIDRRPGFVNGRPGLFWSINGHLYPDVPMFMVTEGDTVQMTISNHSGDVHPMHLHGHHAVVLSRNGVRSDGSPWWVDSLDVRPGESFVIAFKADNPGIWMDHCHNLQHAAQGMVAHLMYEGVGTPFEIGGDSENRPE
jgi:FtsP/CotA-like multicopper oxidase with cupredoxin domain